MEYKTVYKKASAEIIEKKSRFIATVSSASKEKEAVNFINEIKSKYWNAKHNVYAYIIGDNIQRYSDDGEPSGTAGIPSLEVIKKEGLRDVVVVITRYFGGILLGAGGLVRAYGKTTKEGLHAAQIVNMKLCDIVKIEMNYSILGKIQNKIVNEGYVIDKISYLEKVILFTIVNSNESDMFIKNMIDFTNGNIQINKSESKYFAFDQQGKILGD